MPFPLDFDPDVDAPVFQDELGPWLPEAIFDFHSHIFRAEDAPYAQRDAVDPSMPVVCAEYLIEDYLSAMEALFSGKGVHALLFSTVDPEASLRAQNDYVAEAVGGALALDGAHTRRLEGSRGLYSLMMSGLMDDAGEIEEEIRRGGHLGLKPYWSYVTTKAQADVTLEDMIPVGQRRAAEKLGLILMVHIPRLGRLADPVNVEGLARLCEECPRAKVIMAHFGRSYFPEAIGDFRRLLKYENLLVDFAMVQDWEVCEVLIDSFGPERILFGLDMPVAQEKGKLISANGQRHFFTKRVHPWSIHNSAGSYRMKCTYYAYEIIRAFKKASEKVGLGEEDVRKVFLGNALRVVGEVEEGMK